MFSGPSNMPEEVYAHFMPVRWMIRWAQVRMNAK
jgi:hypothetical protein